MIINIKRSAFRIIKEFFLLNVMFGLKVNIIMYSTIFYRLSQKNFPFSITRNSNITKICSIESIYQYCRRKNEIIIEIEPEKIIVEKPIIVGNVSYELKEGEAFCPRAYISAIKEAVIIPGTSFVLSKEGGLLDDEMADFPNKEYGSKHPITQFRYKNNVLVSYKDKTDMFIENGVLISCSHDNNYFHWLVECLPKLLFIDQIEELRNIPLLLPTGLHKNLLSALNRVNINNRKIIFLKENCGYLVERLIYPSGLSRILDRYEGTPIFDEDVVFSHEWIKKTKNLLMKELNISKKPWRKLFITRRKGIRLLENIEDLEELTKKLGFEIVDMDGPTLESQIKLFSEASLIVAVTGAAITNIMFCQPGTKIIALMPDHESSNYYFWPMLGRIVNVEVKIIIGKRLHKILPHYGIHDDFIINPSTLYKELQNSIYEFRQQRISTNEY